MNRYLISLRLNLTFCMALLFCNGLIAQCINSSSFPISDMDTVLYTFTVSGLDNNDLSSNDQCLESVLLSFKHNRVSDVQIKLISPSGQSVILIGPVNSPGNPTGLVNWDFSFVSCNNASPQSGIYPPVWNNQNPWAIFSNVEEPFYPFQGCLEDFNLGSANGIWQIEIIDFFEFSDGQIETLGLVFCDESGLSCDDCQADAGFFKTNELTACQGTEELLITNPIQFFGEMPFPEVYDYQFILASDDQIVGISDDFDFREAAPDSYQVCGISVRDSDKGEIQDVNSLFSIDTLISNNLICAERTDVCMTLEILPRPDTIYFVESICPSDSFIFYGQAFFEEGIYMVDVPSPEETCDTLAILELTITPVFAQIFNEVQQLTCTRTQIRLEANPFVLSDTLEYDFLWSTNEGLIIGENTLDTVTVGAAGMYYLSVTAEACVDIDSVFVASDGELPEIVFDYVRDTLNCNFDELNIVANSQYPLDQVTYAWSDGQIIQENEILVNQPGVYTVTVTTQDQCSATQSISIFEDLTVSLPDVALGTLTCLNQEVMPEVNNTTAILFDWLGLDIENNDFSSTLKEPTINLPGRYKLVYTETNGCKDSIEVEVEIDTIPPFLIDFVSDTITCDHPNAVLTAISNSVNDQLTWTGTGITVLDQNTIEVSQGGLVDLQVLAQNGCTIDTTVLVLEDLAQPIFSYVDTLFVACGEEMQILGDFDAPDCLFSWDGPNLFESDLAEPFVSDGGIYYVSVEGDNGCSRLDSVFVLTNNTVPELSLSSDVLNCYRDSVQITSTPLMGYSFEWEGPTFASNQQMPFITNEGTYHLTVTDLDNLTCSKTFMISVNSDYAAPQASINLDTLDCNKSEALVSFETNATLDSIFWLDFNGYILSSDAEVIIDQAGDYVLSLTGENGCMTIDTFKIIKLESDFSDIQLEITHPNCSDQNSGSIELISTTGGLGPFTISIDNGPFLEELRISSLSAGMYVITVKDDIGCLITAEVALIDNETFDVDLGQDIGLLLGDSIQITPIIGISEQEIAMIQWTSNPPIEICNSCLNPWISPMQSSSITLSITGPAGCKVRDTIYLTVDQNAALFIPNIFSVSSEDALNTSFTLGFGPSIQEVVSMRVYDTWGDLLFEEHNISKGQATDFWDGSFRGTDVIPGTYAYMIEAILTNGKTKVFKGGITLIR